MQLLVHKLRLVTILEASDSRATSWEWRTLQGGESCVSCYRQAPGLCPLAVLPLLSRPTPLTSLHPRWSPGAAAVATWASHYVLWGSAQTQQVVGAGRGRQQARVWLFSEWCENH